MDILKRPTLVLNRNWQPIHVTTVVRSLVMLWNDSAKVVEPETYRLFGWEEWVQLDPPEGALFLRTARDRLRVPEVVCLSRFDRLPSTAVTFSRRNVARRDRHTCQYCGDQPGFARITIDHVIPRAQGGPSNWTNCVAACLRCNARKADRTPEQAGMRLRRPPIRPEWKPFYTAKGVKLANWSRFLSTEPSFAMA